MIQINCITSARLRQPAAPDSTGPLTGFDTPTLRGAWNTAPYLHDGSGPDLAAAVNAHNGVSLSAADMSALVEYLKQIDAQELSAPQPPANVSPTIDSSPVTSATQGQAYSYDVDASDGNGDTLTYSLTTAPAGMTINSVTGLIGWTPGSGQVGSNPVTVLVSDGNGGSATQSFAIDVAAANVSPTIDSSPVTSATEGQAYSYDVDASDGNGDTLTYSLTTSPVGMTINGVTGLIGWTPGSGQVGSNPVTVLVSDGNGRQCDAELRDRGGGGKPPTVNR